MWGTNLKVALVVIGTVAFYTFLANSIPQVESDVPTELAFTGDVSPEQLVQAGEELYLGAGGCTACHGLGTRAPHLLADEGGTGTIGARCANRVPGKDCKTYIHESMVRPNDFVVPGYQPIMPDMSRTLSGTQIWALVAYLQSLGGEVTVTGADLPAENTASPGGSGAPGASPGATAPGSAAPGVAATASVDPLEIIRANQCLACHKLGAEGGPLGPPFDGMGARLRPDQIRRAILQPNADTARGFEQFAGTMPQTFGQSLTAAQLEALVTFIGERR
jgi:mono/diheme cytochrome c family protein